MCGNPDSGAHSERMVGNADTISGMPKHFGVARDPFPNARSTGIRFAEAVERGLRESDSGMPLPQRGSRGLRRSESLQGMRGR